MLYVLMARTKRGGHAARRRRVYLFPILLQEMTGGRRSYSRGGKARSLFRGTRASFLVRSVHDVSPHLALMISPYSSHLHWDVFARIPVLYLITSINAK
jgi:hypothetical protein